MNTGKQVVKNVMWKYLEMFSTMGIQMLCTFIMARFLTPSDYGILGIVLVFSAFADVFIYSGFGQALIREKKVTRIDYSTILYFNIAVSLALYALLFFSSELIADFYGQPILNDVDFTMKEIEQGNAYKINDIYFATNSWELTNTSEIVLDVLIDFLNDNPNIHIEIQGHTDNIGKYEDNLTLSNNRAKAVYDYLIENFIDSNRLSFKGYADKNPIADNKTEEGRALNRRTVFVITKQ